MRKNRNWTGGMTAAIIALLAAVTACPQPDDGSKSGDNPTAISIAAIPGVTAPATGETPVTAISPTAQYTGTVSWKAGQTPHTGAFVAATAYTATIILTAKEGYTLDGVTANFFTVAGANPVTNSANSGVVTAVFPQTGAADDTTPPANVTRLSAIAGNAQVTLNWTNPADADFAKVEITWTPAGGNQPVTVDQPAATATVTGLTNGAAYTFTVKSVDSSGNQSAGATASARPSATQAASYTVTFNSNGGSTVAAQTVTSGGKATEPTNVTKTGYTLKGWYKEETFTTKWNFASDTVTANITLYAEWIVNAHGALMKRTVSGKEIKFRYVPSGKFQRDGTAANVTVITQDYWLSETEVTQELFQAVMETNPSYHTSDAASGETQEKRPVEYVNWYAAIAFCNKLSVADEKEPVYSVSGIDWSMLDYNSIPTSTDSTWDAVTQDLSRNGYRLPTEMEWMWAAMGADKTAQPNTTGYNKAFAGSNRNTNIGEYAWHSSNSSDKTHEAGKKAANELSLSDMSGNVWEWVWDWYGSYSSGELTDLTGPASGTARVIRGGGWYGNASDCAVANRYSSAPYDRDGGIGFRVLAAAQ
jgi:uncharacterized repeat protein (TIGR02543 family)